MTQKTNAARLLDAGHVAAELYDYIYISAGVRGLQIRISPADLISFVGAGVYPL